MLRRSVGRHACDRLRRTNDGRELAPLPLRTLAGWHDFAASGKADVLRPMLAAQIVFRRRIGRELPRLKQAAAA